ncbi:hypothetical protein DID88_006195 [Monilinia fructigena]|uniref:histone deacetylase n=1 Tax=Monilinia fructigena TaxID=38457 RepID=A0A395J1Y7_9HELO|nr:hypothetical protein DID88_006195 [Monilinia fructigena]
MKIIATPRQAYLPTGCCYDDRMKLHASGDFSDNGPHPEDPRRIESIMRTFKHAGLLYSGSAENLGKILEEAPKQYMWRIAAREARKDEIFKAWEMGEYMAAFQDVVMPIAQEFNPDLVIISAGFDAAAGDELGGCFVSPACYSHMTHMLMSLANGRVAVCLEGGYNLSAISRSALAVAKTLMGEPPIRLTIPTINTKAAIILEEVRFFQSPYWECMRSGMFSYKEAQFKGAVRVDDVVRDYQRNVLSKKHGMVSLWSNDINLQEHLIIKSWSLHLINFAKKILIIIHDPAELLAAPIHLQLKFPPTMHTLLIQFLNILNGLLQMR